MPTDLSNCRAEVQFLLYVSSSRSYCIAFCKRKQMAELLGPEPVSPSPCSCRGGAVPGQWSPGCLALLGQGKDHGWGWELPWTTCPGSCVSMQPEQSVIWSSLLPPAASLTLPLYPRAHPYARSRGSCYPHPCPHDTLTPEKFSTDAFVAMNGYPRRGASCKAPKVTQEPRASQSMDWSCIFLCSPSWKHNMVWQPVLPWRGWVRDGHHP